MFLSELIGQAVVLRGAEYTVGDAVFDGGGASLAQLILFDEEGEYAVAAADVASYAPLRLRPRAVLAPPAPRNNPMQSELVTENGKKLGSIRDLELKNAAVKRVVLTRVLALGKATLRAEGARTTLLRPKKAETGAPAGLPARLRAQSAPAPNRPPVQAADADGGNAESAKDPASVPDFKEISNMLQNQETANNDADDGNPPTASAQAPLHADATQTVPPNDSSEYVTAKDADVAAADAATSAEPDAAPDDRNSDAIREKRFSEIEDSRAAEPKNPADRVATDAITEKRFSDATETAANDRAASEAEDAAAGADEKTRSGGADARRARATTAAANRAAPARLPSEESTEDETLSRMPMFSSALGAEAILPAKDFAFAELLSEKFAAAEVSPAPTTDPIGRAALADAEASDPNALPTPPKSADTANTDSGADDETSIAVFADAPTGTNGSSEQPSTSDANEQDAAREANTEEEAPSSDAAPSLPRETDAVLRPRDLSESETTNQGTDGDEAKTARQIPTRIIADYAFLLGRIVTDDITDNGVTVIQKGELILAHTVGLAHRHAKLFELTVKSRS